MDFFRYSFTVNFILAFSVYLCTFRLVYQEFLALKNSRMVLRSWLDKEVKVSYFIVSDLDGDIYIESIHALVTTILK